MKIESCKIKLPEENREEISRQIQEICFANGCKWSKNGTNFVHLDAKWLTVWDDATLTYGSTESKPEISLQDFIAKYGPEKVFSNCFSAVAGSSAPVFNLGAPQDRCQSFIGKPTNQELMLQRDDRSLSKREQAYADRKPAVDPEPVKTIPYLELDDPPGHILGQWK